MCLLITVIAAIIATIVWYTHAEKDTYKVSTLSIIYWGASLMWMIDAIFEYVKLRSDFFNQPLEELVNDALLGIAVVTLGMLVWLAILLIKDPKGIFKKKIEEKIKGIVKS